MKKKIFIIVSTLLLFWLSINAYSTNTEIQDINQLIENFITCLNNKDNNIFTYVINKNSELNVNIAQNMNDINISGEIKQIEEIEEETYKIYYLSKIELNNNEKVVEVIFYVKKIEDVFLITDTSLFDNMSKNNAIVIHKEEEDIFSLLPEPFNYIMIFICIIIIIPLLMFGLIIAYAIFKGYKHLIISIKNQFNDESKDKDSIDYK